MITEYEIVGTQATNRFLTTDKLKAYGLKTELEHKNTNPRMHWLVGRRITDRVVIEIDNQDEENLIRVKLFYSRLLSCEFITIKTMHGYHLIQKDKSIDGGFEKCKIMNPGLEKKNQPKYKYEVDKFFKSLKDSSKELTLSELKERSKLLPEKIKTAGLDHHVGDIDVMHAFLGIQRNRYVLRISKKNGGDKMEILL